MCMLCTMQAMLKLHAMSQELDKSRQHAFQLEAVHREAETKVQVELAAVSGEVSKLKAEKEHLHFVNQQLEASQRRAEADLKEALTKLEVGDLTRMT